MNSISAWPVAWNSALLSWSDWVRHSGWHPVMMAMALATTGFACAVVWSASIDDARVRRSWLAAAAVLQILALNSLMALDLLVVFLLRGVAQQQGWYAARRAIQAPVLFFLAGTAVLACLWLPQLALRRAPGLRWLLHGLLLLLIVSVLRAVSLHATDRLLGVRITGWSLGRLIDIVGLAIVGTGVFVALRTRKS
jgi:hypothetical protein